MIKFWGMIIKNPTDEEMGDLDNFIKEKFGDKPKRFYNFDTENVDNMPESSILMWVKNFIRKVNELKK